MTETSTPEPSELGQEVEITDADIWAELREQIARDIDRFDPAPDPYAPIRRATPADVGLIYAIGKGDIFPEEAELHRIVRIPDDREEKRWRLTLLPELVPEVYDWIATRLEDPNCLVLVAEDTISWGGVLIAHLDRDRDGEAGLCIELHMARMPQTLTRLHIIIQQAATRRGMQVRGGCRPEFLPKEDVPCGETPQQFRDEVREYLRRAESAFIGKFGIREELHDRGMLDELFPEFFWRVDDTERPTAESGSAGPKPRADRFLAEDYAVRDGRLCRRRYSRETKDFIWEPLVNGTIHIIRKLRLDDGTTTTTQLEVVARRDDGTTLEPEPLLVSGADFASQGWLSKTWAAELRVRPSLSSKDHLRAAIETLSEERMKQTRIFIHTGWREIGGHLRYLSASGALGDPAVTVRLNPPLDRYRLPAVPTGVPEAVRQSVRLLALAPRAVTVPLLAAVYRAPLAHFVPTPFSLWLLGKTGAQKSTLSAVFLSHYGNFADKEQLPANWSSTGNAILQALFVAKDMLVVIDDFARDRADPRVLDAIAAQVLRAQGNLAGRGRLRSDLSEQPSQPPRGLLIVTGEDFPGGESLAVRGLTLSLEPGMVNLDQLTRAQESGRREQLRHALAGFIQWETERAAKGLREALLARFYELRAAFRAEPHPDDDGVVPHDRTPEILSHLALGLDELATFAETCGALSPAEAADLREQGIDDLKALASGQTSRAATQKPSLRFLSFLTTMLAQRRAQLLRKGKAPSEARVPPAVYGWEDGEYWLLLGDAVYPDWAASCNATHEPLPTRTRLWQELVVEGIVEPSHEKGRNRRTTKAITTAGQSHRVLMIKRTAAATILGLESLDAGTDDPPAPEPAGRRVW